MFGPRFARHLASRYRKRGLDKTAARMVTCCRPRTPRRQHPEIGGGVGDIQLELLDQGASRTTNLELVDAYDTDATELAETAGMRDRMTRRQVDIAATPDEVEAHDIVVLHRSMLPRLRASPDRGSRPCPTTAGVQPPTPQLADPDVHPTATRRFPNDRQTFQIFAHPPAAMVTVAEGRSMHRLHPPGSGLADRRPRERASYDERRGHRPPAKLRNSTRHATTATRASTIFCCSVIAAGRARTRSAKYWRCTIGTGRNLPFYPRGIQLTGIDFSPAMLDIARDRAAARSAWTSPSSRLTPSTSIPMDDRFDTVVCTLALSSIRDPAAAINEMYRVLDPGGQLLVVGHVAAPTEW